MALNPNGVVPTLVEDDGFVIWESMAINWYMSDKYRPEWLGAAPEVRSRALQWSICAEVALDDQFRMYLSERWYGQNRKEYVDMDMGRITRGLGILDKYLESKTFISGGAFSVADLNVGSTVSWAPDIEYDLAQFPNVKKHFEICQAGQSFQTAKQRL